MFGSFGHCFEAAVMCNKDYGEKAWPSGPQQSRGKVSKYKRQQKRTISYMIYISYILCFITTNHCQYKQLNLFSDEFLTAGSLDVSGLRPYVTLSMLMSQLSVN